MREKITKHVPGCFSGRKSWQETKYFNFKILKVLLYIQDVYSISKGKEIANIFGDIFI